MLNKIQTNLLPCAYCNVLRYERCPHGCALSSSLIHPSIHQCCRLTQWRRRIRGTLSVIFYIAVNLELRSVFTLVLMIIVKREPQRSSFFVFLCKYSFPGGSAWSGECSSHDETAHPGTILLKPFIVSIIHYYFFPDDEFCIVCSLEHHSQSSCGLLRSSDECAQLTGTHAE